MHWICIWTDDLMLKLFGATLAALLAFTLAAFIAAFSAFIVLGIVVKIGI